MKQRSPLPKVSGQKAPVPPVKTIQSSLASEIFGFLKTPGFRKYFANTAWMMVERIIQMGASFVVGAYVARYLGPKNLGLLSYAACFAGFFVIFAFLGLEAIVIKELVGKPGDRNRILGTVFWMKLSAAFLVLSILSALMLILHDDSSILILIIATGIIFQSFYVIDFHFQSKVLTKFVVYAQLVQLLVSCAIKVVLVLNNAPIYWFAVVYTIDHLVMAVGLVVIYFKKEGDLSFIREFDTNLVSTFVKESWPLIFSGVIITIYMSIDKIMLKVLLDFDAVGIYTAATRLSVLWYFFPIIIMNSIFPMLIDAKKSSESTYQHRLQLIHDFLLSIAVFVSLVATFFATDIVLLVFGKEYIQSAGVLAIHIWASVFVFTAAIRGKWFVLEKLTQYALYQVIIGAVINIIVNLLLIPMYGPSGAAFATVIARFSSFYLSMLIFKKIRPLASFFHTSIFLPVRMTLYLFNLKKREKYA